MGSQTAYRKLVLTVISFGLATLSYAQPFGNEWINFNQTYYRIRLTENGIYRLTQSDLVSAGIPVNTIDPRRIQLYHRGVEQAIVIEGQSDGSFDGGDFLEFYGQRNDGSNETELYLNPADQPHDRYSLFSDSAAYFLTWQLSPTNGKRASTFFENNTSGIPPEDYHFEENLQLYTNNFSPGRSYSGGNVRLSQFDVGEGWTGTDISKGNSSTFTLTNVINTFTSGPKPNLRVLLAGRNNLSHSVDILVGPSTASLRLLSNAQFNAHDNFLLDTEIEWSDIDASGELVVRISVLGIGEDADRAAVSLIELDFPQVLDMDSQNSKTFVLREEPSNKSFIDVSSSPGNIRLYDITDPDNLLRIGVNQTAAQFDAVIPATASTRTLIAYNSPLNTVRIQPVSFDDIDANAFDYLVITHPDLMAATTEGDPDPVNSYKDYRESSEGGGYDVYVASILTLYDQFNYGEPSPLAIRRFTDFMLSNGNPGYLFLIGEALDIPNDPDRQTQLALEASGLAHYVPTMGFPGSDIALIAGLAGSGITEPIPIGRITAKSPDEVQAYLNKVIEYEAVPYDDLWRKRLIHLSGGTTPFELTSFRSNVDGFRDVAISEFLGGSVSTVSKQSSNPIELFNVSDAVNEGVGLITFFGHSGPNGSDIDIGRVSDPSFGYNNQGLYNTILVNGCNAGDVFGTFFSLGEDWILTPDKGSVAYMAHSDNGLSNQLRNYTDLFYEVGYGDSTFIAQSVGQIKREAGDRYSEQFTSGEVHQTQVQQFILQGDPAVKLFGESRPDYAVTENDIAIRSFDGAPVTSLTDSFTVDVIIRNFGITSSQPVGVTVNRFLTDGTIQSFGPDSFEAIFFQDTVSITINTVSGQTGFGNNRFEVIIDDEDEITELSKLNNSASIDFFISSGTTVNLFPRNFGIESDESVRFVSQSSDQLSDERGFQFELDTTRAFNSPLAISRSGNFKVLAEWNIELPFAPNDTVVYYWRTKFTEILPGEEDVFAESSFSYIPDSPNGWAQSTFDQFDLLVSDGLIKNEVSNQWEFIQTELAALIKTHGTSRFSGDPVLYDSLVVTLDGENILKQNQNNNICREDAFNLLAFDKASLFNYIIFGVNTMGFDNQKCGGTPFIINNLSDAEISSSLLLNDYIDGINDGDFVILQSIGQLNYNSWPATVTDKMAELGIDPTFITSLTPGQPVIILGIKGSDPGDALTLSGAVDETITFDDLLTGNFTNGSLTTPRIGPSSRWREFFRQASFGDPGNDDFSYDIIGVNTDGTDEVLFSDLNNDTQDISQIKADDYPFLKLAFKTNNEGSPPPSQLRKWQVTFRGVPEGILLTDDPLVSRDNTLEREEGEILETTYYFKNISNRNFQDSIPTTLTSFNMESRQSSVENIKLPPISSGDSATFSFPLNTLGKAGLNDINVFVNPNEIPEVTINNNIIDIKDFVQVNADNTNPILDVTFDGVYILDGDIVSPSPNILVKIKDDNPYLFKEDTSGVTLSIRRPCESCEFERINFSSPDLIITPADENTDFQLEYNPQQLEDGIYGLRVQGSDFSGNQSGVTPYEINFEVINESTITHFYPYPNPFSTSTRFVFTLTGSEIPDQIKIQIMTVSGKIVREITQDELGPIRIGNNLTDYAWDGRDEYGDQLANGVYLYRVVLRNNGEKMDRRETSADKAFKNGFGKLYLLR